MSPSYSGARASTNKTSNSQSDCSNLNVHSRPKNAAGVLATRECCGGENLKCSPTKTQAVGLNPPPATSLNHEAYAFDTNSSSTSLQRSLNGELITSGATTLSTSAFPGYTMVLIPNAALDGSSVVSHGQQAVPLSIMNPSDHLPSSPFGAKRQRIIQQTDQLSHVPVYHPFSFQHNTSMIRRPTSYLPKTLPAYSRQQEILQLNRPEEYEKMHVLRCDGGHDRAPAYYSSSYAYASQPLILQEGWTDSCEERDASELSCINANNQLESSSCTPRESQSSSPPIPVGQGQELESSATNDGHDKKEKETLQERVKSSVDVRMQATAEEGKRVELGSNDYLKSKKRSHSHESIAESAQGFKRQMNESQIKDRNFEERHEVTSAKAAPHMLHKKRHKDMVYSNTNFPGFSVSLSKTLSTAESDVVSSSGATASGNNYDEAWNARLEELKRYKAKYGNCLVPKKSQTHPELGIWVMNQRAQYKLLQENRTYTNSAGNSKPSTMTAERIRALEDVGFVWSICDHVDWDDRLEELREYKRQHGDCLVPNKYPLNPQLGTWVNKQRTQYKLMCDGKPSSMTKERVACLNALDFVWSKRDLVDWSHRLEELKQYKAQHGDCLVPNKYPPNPQLGIWAMHQRAQYRKLREGKPSPMTEERIQALENVGFVWAISNADLDWEKRVLELRLYKTKFGNCLVPNKFPENPKLGAWVGKQRKQYKLFQEGKTSTLTAERVKVLEDLGFAWSLRSLVDWDARWVELRRFKRVHGHCLVPQQYPENPQLGTWVSNQRKQYRLLQENKPSPMTMERVKKLESLGFVWSKFSHDSLWEAKLDELREYKDKYGDCKVSEDYHANPTLGSWVHHQRAQYAMMIEGRPSNMTPEKIEALEGMEFEWELERYSSADYLKKCALPSQTPASCTADGSTPPATLSQSGTSNPLHNAWSASEMPESLPSTASNAQPKGPNPTAKNNELSEGQRLGGLGALIMALEADSSTADEVTKRSGHVWK